MTDLSPLLDSVRLCARLCREVQQHFLSRSEKAANDPVTIADYGAQAIICRALIAHFPDDAVISEESGKQFLELVDDDLRAQIIRLVGEVLGEQVDQATLVEWLDHGTQVTASRTWLIDPIDGTKGFLKLRHYVNAIGLLQDGEPVGAVIGAPAYPGAGDGLVFYTHDGAAYAVPMGGGEPERLRVSDRSDPAAVRAVESVEKGHSSHERMARARAAAGISEDLVERADSQEKYARLAKGDAELYLRLTRVNSTRPHMVWDHGPGTALVRAAGGRATDLDGSPLDFSLGPTLAKNQGIIATNGPIHDRVIEAVCQLLAEEA